MSVDDWEFVIIPYFKSSKYENQPSRRENDASHLICERVSCVKMGIPKSWLRRSWPCARWRIDILQDGHWLPSNATVDAHGPLQTTFRQSEKRSISIDAKLVNEISCDSGWCFWPSVFSVGVRFLSCLIGVN